MEPEPKIKFYKITLKQKIKKQIRQFRIYCYTSLMSAVFMFIFLFIFTSLFHIFYLFSLFVVYGITVSVSFVLNKLYVFNLFNPKKLSKQYYHFFIISGLAFIGNFLALYILVEFVDLYYLFAQLCIGLVGLPILFISHKRFVFSHV
jgi:putative flippase GtrA